MQLIKQDKRNGYSTTFSNWEELISAIASKKNKEKGCSFMKADVEFELVLSYQIFRMEWNRIEQVTWKGHTKIIETNSLTTSGLTKS